MIKIDVVDTNFEIYENNDKMRYLHHQTKLVQIVEYKREPTKHYKYELEKVKVDTNYFYIGN